MCRNVGTSNRQKIRAIGLILWSSKLTSISLSIIRKVNRDKIIMKKIFTPLLDRIYSTAHQHSTMIYEGLRILVYSEGAKL